MRLRVLVLLSALPGCAFFSKADVPMRRYFSPDFPSAGPASTTPTVAGRELRLGRVTAGGAIGERIMFRASEHEVGFYDDWSWTEKPQAHLRRGLSHVLFEEKGLRSTLGGSGPTLEVELIRFEEVRLPAHVGRVKLAFSLSDERLVSLQQTLTVERPIPATDPHGEASAVAGAMGEALRDAIDEVSTRVVAELDKVPTAQVPCPAGATAQKP